MTTKTTQYPRIVKAADFPYGERDEGYVLEVEDCEDDPYGNWIHLTSEQLKTLERTFFPTRDSIVDWKI